MVFHMRFREGQQGVLPILAAVPRRARWTVPTAPTRQPGGPRAVKRGEPQMVAWACERPDGGRGFGFTGGHYHRNWGNDDFRKLVLNAILWTAKVEVLPGASSARSPKTTSGGTWTASDRDHHASLSGAFPPDKRY